jgi:glycosyltransferase involved in cell wall biosynthesis
VSVVVPVRNPGRDLVGLTACLAHQSLGHDRFEVLIADDGSTDGSTDLLEDESGFLRVIRLRSSNSYAARNEAAARAKAPVLAFCDADCRPAARWLEMGLEALEGKADLVGGAIRFIVPERPKLWDLIDMDTFLDQERAVRDGGAVTANLFVRREVFLGVGGFDTRLPSGGDYDLVARAVRGGARLTYEPRAVVAHPTRGELGAVLRKLWRTQTAYGARIVDGRSALRRMSLGKLFPPLEVARNRRQAGRTLVLDRARLRENGVEPRLRDDLLALPFLYLIIPYGKRVAHLWGLISFHLGGSERRPMSD